MSSGKIGGATRSPESPDLPCGLDSIRDRALGNCEQRYHLLFESSVAGMYLSTLEGEIVDVNEAFAKILGYNSRDEVLAGRADDLYVARSDREAFVQKLVAARKLGANEIRLKRKDGSAVWVLENAILLAGEFICGTLIDITVQKSLQEQRNRNELLLRQVVESANDVIVMQDGDGRYIYANHSRQYGVSSRDMIGKTPYQIFDRATADLMMKRVRRVVSSGQPITEEEKVSWEGQDFWFHTRLFPVMDAEGNVVAVTTFARNITELKLTASHLRETEERLRMERMRTQISSDLHDQLGSTLGSLLLFAEMIRRHAEGPVPEASSMLGKLESSVRSALGELDEIVWSVKPEYDTLRSLVSRIRDHSEEVFGAAGIRHHFEISGVPGEQTVGLQERHHLFLLFREAVNNVVRHAGCTHAEVRVEIDGTRVTITIRDDGRGFDPLRIQAGDGLGNMKKRAIALGGDVQIESAAGKGTCVTVVWNHMVM